MQLLHWLLPLFIVSCLFGSTTNLGAAQDTYNGSNPWSSVNLGTITITSAGTRYFKFTAAGKNAASSGYWIFIDAIRLYEGGVQFRNLLA